MHKESIEMSIWYTVGGRERDKRESPEHQKPKCLDMLWFEYETPFPTPAQVSWPWFPDGDTILGGVEMFRRWGLTGRRYWAVF